MNFDLSEEHKAVQEAAKIFAENECKPGVIDRDSCLLYTSDAADE